MPKKPAEEKIVDLRAQSADSDAEKVKGGAQPSGGPSKVEPVTGGPLPAEPRGGSRIL